MCFRPSHGFVLIMFHIKMVLKLPKFSRAPRASNRTSMMSPVLTPDNSPLRSPAAKFKLLILRLGANYQVEDSPCDLHMGYVEKLKLSLDAHPECKFVMEKLCYENF